MSQTRAFITACSILAGCSCGDSAPSPTGPSAAVGPLTGTWTGTLSRPGVAQSVRLELTEVAFGIGFVASGRYTVGNSATTTGTVGGVFVDNTSINLSLSPSVRPECNAPQPLSPAGEMLLNVTLSGNQLAGRTVFVLCGSEAVGTVSLAK
jgi:hypothetical protein